MQLFPSEYFLDHCFNSILQKEHPAICPIGVVAGAQLVNLEAEILGGYDKSTQLDV
jgi:hypothetical protein